MEVMARDSDIHYFSYCQQMPWKKTKPTVNVSTNKFKAWYIFFLCATEIIVV